MAEEHSMGMPAVNYGQIKVPRRFGGYALQTVLHQCTRALYQALKRDHKEMSNGKDSIKVLDADATPMPDTQTLFCGVCRMGGSNLWQSIDPCTTMEAAERQLEWWLDKKYQDPHIFLITVPKKVVEDD